MSSSMSMTCSQPISTQDSLHHCIEDALESLAMVVQINAYGSEKEDGLSAQQLEAIRAATTLVEYVHRMRHTAS